MRTFDQEQLNRFILHHIIDVCDEYEEAQIRHDEYRIDYYFSQILAYNNMAVVFADTDTYLEIQKIARKALKIGEDK